MDKFARRLARVQRLVRRQGLDYLFLAAGADMYYVTGLRTTADERLQVLAIPAGETPALVVPAMYEQAVRPAAAGGLRVLAWADQADPFVLLKSALPKAGRAAVDDRMRAGHLLGLMQALPGCQFGSAGQLLPGLRERKDQSELTMLERAGRLADRVMLEVPAQIRPGVAERELARWIGTRLEELGAQDVSFRPIIASGPNGASPHHLPGKRKFRRGDFIVVDFGCIVAGYCSDITRTFCLGRATPEMREVYRVVSQANEGAFAAASAGVPCAAVDRAARGIIAEAGYGAFFTHRTGHGIGLECHEEPYLVQGNQHLLAAGMVFSVEPGIYLPGRFGVRVEDIVALSAQGPRRLNDVTRELVEI